MKTSKLLVSVTAGLMLSGCGKWLQDPLDGKKGAFERARPVPTKPDLEKPLPSGSVKIMMPDFQSFEEGVKTEFPISARVLLEGYTAEVSVENLADFPGATYDKATKLFSWTPPLGFVSSIGENGVIAQLPLIVRAYGYKPDAQVLVDDQERPIYISRQLNDPMILSADKPEPFLREGNTMRVPVVVFDKDALSYDRSTWPKLSLTAVGGAKSLSALATLRSEESLGANKYLLTLEIDGRDIELSDSIDRFKLAMFVSTRFGKVSPSRELFLDVYTSFTTPVSTWRETLEARATETISHKFIITDPKLEANLSLESTYSLPQGSDLTCQATGRGMLNCTFTWTPSEAQIGRFDFQAYIKSRNTNAADTVQPTKTLNFRTQVLPKGS